MLFLLYSNYYKEIKKSSTYLEVDRLKSYQLRIYRVVMTLLVVALMVVLWLFTPTKYDFISHPDLANYMIKVIQFSVISFALVISYVSFLMSSVKRIAKIQYKVISVKNHKEEYARKVMFNKEPQANFPYANKYYID